MKFFFRGPFFIHGYLNQTTIPLKASKKPPYKGCSIRQKSLRGAFSLSALLISKYGHWDLLLCDRYVRGIVEREPWAVKAGNMQEEGPDPSPWRKILRRRRLSVYISTISEKCLAGLI